MLGILAMLLALPLPGQAGILTFNSGAPSGNGTQRAAWLAAIGAAGPAHVVDFESGFVAGQNISGIGGFFPAGLIIRDTGPGVTKRVIVCSSTSCLGGSNPVGSFSVAHDEQAYLELDFSASPVDYVAFQDIDQSGTSGIVTFVGGATASIALDDTGLAGDTAEFFGIYRNDLPLITRVELDASGDGEWGVDTIEYGVLGIVSARHATWGSLKIIYR